MEWLNYHHLFYFWMVAREGTVSGAAAKLHLARPTVTAQVRELENSVGQKLFRRRGRGLELTEFGQQVFHYADQIFAIGHELRDFLRTGQGRKRFRVGMPDVVPKLIAFELLKPVMQVPDRPRTECCEGKLQDLLSDLVVHKLDLVISDSPAPTSAQLGVFSHKLGECGVSLLGTASLVKEYGEGFPGSLTKAPVLLPAQHTAIRRPLDRWLDERGVVPDVVAEFEDSALLKVFGQAGQGIFPVPTVIEENVKQQYGVSLVGRIAEVRDEFYAISVEKRVQHAVALQIVNQARNGLFEET